MKMAKHNNGNLFLKINSGIFFSFRDAEVIRFVIMLPGAERSYERCSGLVYRFWS